MKPSRFWSQTRYRPVIHGDDDIYICQIIPQHNTILLFWKFDGEHKYTVHFRRKESDDDWTRCKTREDRISLENLAFEADYEFFVSTKEHRSAVGFAKTGDTPGTVVNYLHPEDPKYAFSGQHLCSPSLLKHPNGYLLASMDLYEGRMPQNLTLIFRSDDGGESWYHYTELFPCFWGKLFLHKGDVYMLATSTEYGDLLIGRSIDGGKHWLTPTVLLRGSCHSQVAGWHKSAMPVVEHCGRLWTGIDYGAWATGGHANALLSVSVDADLLDAESWCLTDPISYDPKWQGSVRGDARGFLEGNAVVLPNGDIANVLRYSTGMGEPKCGLIPILRGDCREPSKRLAFDRYVPFSGNLSKFDILFDEVSRFYYSIVSRIYSEEIPNARNLLSLLRSFDFEHWEVVGDLLDYSDKDHKSVGFQYVSFLFDGDDILYLSRTAINGAQSFHDNNYITFHRIKNFRMLKPIEKGVYK